MIYHITHTTTYDYTQPVSLCHNLAHLVPRLDARQHTFSCDLRIAPEPAVIESRFDYFNNPVTFFTVQESHRRLVVRAEHRTEVHSPVLFDMSSSPPWEDVREQVQYDRNPDPFESYQFVFNSPYVKSSDELLQYALVSFAPRRPLLEAAFHLTQRIYGEFTYDTRATTLATTLPELLKGRRGVCQDFAHLMIGCLRSLGLPARYVSGYLLTRPPVGKARLIGADASHAWVAIWCPHFGWIDFDPTNGKLTTNEHILLAWGRDYDDVSPIKGVILGGGSHQIRVEVDVIEEGTS